MTLKVRKSLRSTLTLVFLGFSIVPLAFISGYSTVLYEGSLNSELRKRLEGNLREIGVNLAETEATLVRFGKLHSADPALVYHVATRNTPTLRRMFSEWLRTYTANQIAIYDNEGRILVSQRRYGEQDIRPNSEMENGDVFLSQELISHTVPNLQTTLRQLQAQKGLQIIVYTRITKKDGAVVGYLEESKEMGAEFLAGIKKRLNLEVLFFNEKNEAVFSSNPEFLNHNREILSSKIENKDAGFFDVVAKGELFGVIVRKVVDGQGRVYANLGLAASKSESQKVLQRIKVTLLTMTALLLLLLVPILIFVSNRIVKPIYLLVEATEDLQSGTEKLPNISNDNEIGYLVEAFRGMAAKISAAREDLEKKIDEVEKANQELRSTQATLVHSAKMASLGQLVAGVAHELNNPIGFIYSNMAHLKDYMDKFKKVLDTAENSPGDLEAVKKDVDFNYIVEDFPKLIASCEDGARRTRDIVIGLRNFSRLDEAQIKSVDITEGVKDTLKLLAGELKNKVRVHEDYGHVPPVRCYASQLNQVFMNIISNAAQAIEKDGDIWIKIWHEGSDLYVSIKDNGPGIPKEVQDRIFDPFFTTKPVGKGTGLGLSISYGIIQKHNGEIILNSEDDKGTEFIIKVPVQGPKENVI